MSKIETALANTGIHSVQAERQYTQCNEGKVSSIDKGKCAKCEMQNDDEIGIKENNDDNEKIQSLQPIETGTRAYIGDNKQKKVANDTSNGNFRQVVIECYYYSNS